MKIYCVICVVFVLCSIPVAAAKDRTQYLSFQLFTNSFDSRQLRENFPPPEKDMENWVKSIIQSVGATGNDDRHLGFIPGPISFDNTNDEVRTLIRSSFSLAIKYDIAVGFHVDDSMFWGRLAFLDAPQNIEWSDWDGTPNTGRRVDWSSQPTKLMPQLCFNSPAVEAEVRNRAAVIGEEVRRGLALLQALNREALFIGVIAGWETQIGRDFDSGKHLGYHALVNKGFGPKNPPADFEAARVEVVQEFIDLWASSLARGGVPADRVIAHFAFDPRGSPPQAAFGKDWIAGFSTYPQPGFFKAIQSALQENGNPPWASCEGTAVDPGVVESGGKGMPMELYLGDLFHLGAFLVNVYGWGVGPKDFPFRRIAEGQGAVEAYRKFVRGESLAWDPARE